MRHLHAGLPHGLEGSARREPAPDRARSPLLARRQPLPLHRLRQDHPRRAEGGRRDGFERATSARKGHRTWSRRRSPVNTRSSAPARSAPTASTRSPVARQYGADTKAEGMLFGAVLRSPHAHATHQAHRHLEGRSALPGVKAVVTARTSRTPAAARSTWAKARASHANCCDNVLASDKALYHGHAVAAVAATDAAHRRGRDRADRRGVRGAARR